MKKTILCALARCATTIVAQAPAKPQPPKPNFWYGDNWTDNAGVSHMTHCPVTSFELKSKVAAGRPAVSGQAARR